MQNVFDLSDPREDALLYRLANRYHYRTRERTVREHLLFASGDAWSARHAAETARILRSRIYLSEAWIVPVRYDAAANVVDVSVTVRDVWTLNAIVAFARSGGENRTRFELEELNLLGRGRRLSLARTSDVDRTGTAVQFDDPNVLGSWWQVGVALADYDDGHVRSLAVQRPFYAFDVRRAGGLSLQDVETRRSRYDRGRIVDQFVEERRRADAWTGWSRGLVDGWSTRWYAGVRHERAQFARDPVLARQPARLPEDRELAYPWLGWQLVEDRFRETENVDLIGRTEDQYLGRSLYLELGWAAPAFGADRRALLVRGAAQSAWQPDEATQLFANATLDGRWEDEAGVRNLLFAAGGRWYRRFGERQMSYASLSGAVTERLDAERQLLLGGDSGLRGYPLRFQDGTSRALLTLEHRVYTDWYPFRLVRVGGAVFFDAGRTWGRSLTGAEPLGVLKDVGVGLRLGNVRMGLGNVLHVDLSYALDAPPGIDRVQLTVESKARF